ncbi:barstar family protein [Streptomyces virginiae]|uniref:barstar family protein n=1 Tax=Streptomyces virginiae TaxID=1961 RepID=UPI00367D8A25
MHSKTVPYPPGSCPPRARARLNCPTHHVPVGTITVARSSRREDLAHDGRARSDGTPRSAPAAGGPGDAGSGLPLQHLRPGASFLGYFGHNWDALVDCLQGWHVPGHNHNLAILIEHADHPLVDGFDAVGLCPLERLLAGRSAVRGHEREMLGRAGPCVPFRRGRDGRGRLPVPGELPSAAGEALQERGQPGARHPRSGGRCLEVRCDLLARRPRTGVPTRKTPVRSRQRTADDDSSPAWHRFHSCTFPPRDGGFTPSAAPDADGVFRRVPTLPPSQRWRVRIPLATPVW